MDGQVGIEQCVTAMQNLYVLREIIKKGLFKKLEQSLSLAGRGLEPLTSGL